MRGSRKASMEKNGKLEQDKYLRNKIFKDLCAHISNGFSLESFPDLSPNSIQKYLKEYPEEFIQEELEQAFRKGRTYWEGIGIRQANGECMGNSRTWYYNMANRFGWREKLDIEAEHKGQVNVNVVNYATQKALTDKQEE